MLVLVLVLVLLVLLSPPSAQVGGAKVAPTPTMFDSLQGRVLRAIANGWFLRFEQSEEYAYYQEALAMQQEGFFHEGDALAEGADASPMLSTGNTSGNTSGNASGNASGSGSTADGTPKDSGANSPRPGRVRAGAGAGGGGGGGGGGGSGSRY